MSGAQVVLAPNPSIYTGQGTNTYLVGDDDGLLCIDPGPDIDAHLTAILDAVAARDGRIATILLTHSHPDHRPLARRLADATGAPVRALDVALGDGAVLLDDGETVAASRSGALRAVHTPGHARDHLCFLDESNGHLYTGDHVLGGMTTVISPPDGDMTDYMASLERIRELRPSVIHPGHGPRIDDAAAVIDDYIAHRRDRENQVEGAARDLGVPVRPVDLVPSIYAAYPQALWEAAARSVQAHLDKLVRDGRARRVGDADEPRYTVP